MRARESAVADLPIAVGPVRISTFLRGEGLSIVRTKPGKGILGELHCDEE